MDIKPVTLTGQLVRLEPLSEAHAPDLTLFGKDEAIWKYMRYGVKDTEEKMREFIRYLLGYQTRGTAVPFAVIDLTCGRAIGMTRYMDIQPENLALEIGGTWYGMAYQRTGTNTECKYLLLQHAFEEAGVNRVQFKADERNERSLKAIERIGALREGVLRENMVMADGYRRSSVYFSILFNEWPAVKDRLIGLMARKPDHSDS